MSSKQWREYLRQELEVQKQNSDENDWSPDISEEVAIRETFWRMKPDDECYDEFEAAYNEFCRSYDLSADLDVYRDREKFRETDPENPYRAAKNNAWKIIDSGIFKSPQEKAMEFDDIKL